MNIINSSFVGCMIIAFVMVLIFVTNKLLEKKEFAPEDFVLESSINKVKRFYYE